MTSKENKQSPNFDLSALDLLELDDPIYSDRPAVPHGKKYVEFVLDGKNYAIASSFVSEIFQPMAITRLFNMPAWLLGIAGFRNEIISVVDLKKLWNAEADPSSLKSRLVVLRGGKHQTPVAFAVDKLGTIITVADGEILPNADTDLPHIKGILKHDSTTLHLLDAEKVLSSLALSA